ncbi:hypothetical protein [Streptomyces sp. NPDC059209]|uniref:hypothetical protein n=1 Tax=Streptomyces sp. NPDC059209 TaxID=3346769 RepID=UPI0036AD6D3F
MRRHPDPAQPLSREIEGFYVRTGLPQVSQRRQVDSFPASGLRALIVVFGFGGRGREQVFGRRRPLAPGDVVRAPTPGGGAQLPARHRTDDERAVVQQRDAGYPPLLQGPGPGAGARPVRPDQPAATDRVRHEGLRAAGGLHVGQGRPAVQRR